MASVSRLRSARRAQGQFLLTTTLETTSPLVARTTPGNLQRLLHGPSNLTTFSTYSNQPRSSLGDYTVSLGGWSTVAVRGSRSSTGGPVIAKNFDYLPQIQPYYILRESKPQGGSSSNSLLLLLSERWTRSMKQASASRTTMPSQRRSLSNPPHRFRSSLRKLSTGVPPSTMPNKALQCTSSRGKLASAPQFEATEYKIAVGRGTAFLNVLDIRG